MTEERRLVTVLFADVTGSTALGEALDPEDVRALLGRYYNIAKDVIGVHGGTVEKFIGDAVMAVFGLPTAHGDDAERALAAALELRERVRADPKLGEQMPIRLGVNTGDAVATRDTSGGDFLVTGDAVNVAARLQQAAEPWQIVCGERTVRAAESAFTFEPFAGMAAKGKSTPVPMAVLRGRAATRRRVRLPLIGRASELAQLELVAQRALRQKRPALVSIVAPAGVGKSRLLEEFVDRLPDVVPGSMLAIAQCLPYGQRLTYWPLRAVLFGLVGAADHATPVEVRDAIGRWLAGADVGDQTRVGELLASTVGAGPEASDRAALFAAWRTAFEVAASRAPLVIVFEDLHWSSDSLLDLVEFVMQQRGDAPVLTIALTRPELLDRRPSYGAGRRNYTSIALDPLPDEDIASIVEHLLESSPPEVVARVVERCEGNPFYAGELVRSLVERAGSLADAGAVERALAALPDTVQATVLARLDLLPPAERRTLQMGAVLGRSFSARGIAALEPDLADQVDGAVDDLVERDMVRPAGGDRYTFRHILIREVAYQTLPRTERARLHAAAGEWLEDIAGENDAAYAELIAFHYREAASLPGHDEAAASEIKRRATTWLRRAAEAAIASAAYLEASRHLEAAIAFAPSELLPDLYERLGDAGYSGHGKAEAYRTALRHAREQGREEDQQLRIMAGLLEILMRAQGSVPDRPSAEEMAALRAEAAQLAAHVTDERALARYLGADAFYPFWIRGDVTEAEHADADAKARRAVEMARSAGDARIESLALDALGSLLADRGDHAGSRALAMRRIAMRDLDLFERLDAYSMATWMSLALGELDEAIRISADGAAIAQPGQADAWTLHLLAWRTCALYLRGDWVEAIATGERAHQRWADGGRVAAGYAIRGFVCAYRAARGRGAAGAAERMRATGEAIIRSFPEDSDTRRSVAFFEPEPRPDALVRVLEGSSGSGTSVERAAALITDLGEASDPAAIEAAAARVRPGAYVAPMAAQVERAIAVARRDIAGLERARAMFETMGARPFVARTRVERALLTGDEAELSAGLAELERIGDVEQIERYERRRRAAGA